MESGFPNVKAHNQTFRSLFGTSPRNWREVPLVRRQTSRYRQFDEPAAMQILESFTV